MIESGEQRLQSRERSGSLSGISQFVLLDSLKENTKIQGTSSLLVGVMNFIQMTIGAAILGLPGAFVKLGGIMGFSFLIVGMIINIWSMNLLIRWKERTKLKSYEEILEHALGKVGYWLPNIIVWIFLLIVHAVLLCIIVQFFFPILHYTANSSLANYQSKFSYIMFGCIAVLVYPLLCLRDLTTLGFTSFFGVCCIFILIILTTVVAGFYQQLEPPIGGRNYFNAWPKPGKYTFLEQLGSVGTILSAYLSIFGIPDIHESLKKKSDMKHIINYGNYFALAAYMWMSIAVYIFLFDQEYDAVINKDDGNLFVARFTEPGDKKTLIIGIAGCFEAIALCLRLPLFHFLWRKRTFDMLNRFQCECFQPTENDEMPNLFFFGHTIFWFMTVGLAMFYSDVGAYLGFLGLIIGGSMMLVFPSLLGMIDNGGIKHNITFGLMEKTEYNFDSKKKKINVFVDDNGSTVEDYCKTSTEFEETQSPTMKIITMIELNLIFYCGCLFSLNSFNILISGFMKK